MVLDYLISPVLYSYPDTGVMGEENHSRTEIQRSLKKIELSLKLLFRIEYVVLWLLSFFLINLQEGTFPSHFLYNKSSIRFLNR